MFSKSDTAFLFCIWLTYAWKHDIRIWAVHHKHWEERLRIKKTTQQTIYVTIKQETDNFVAQEISYISSLQILRGNYAVETITLSEYETRIFP